MQAQSRWSQVGSLPAFALVSLLFPLSARAQKQICIMNIDGTGMRTLVDMPGYDWVGSPYWSRDGKRIVFDAMQGGFQNNHIFVIDAAGGQPHDIGLGSQPSCSADDKQICFYMHDGNPDGEKPGVYVMNADGKGRQFVTPGIRPRWYSQSGRIAYLNERNGANTLWIYSALEAENKAILGDEFAEVESPPVWSKDGKQIAFLGRRQGSDNPELCVVETEGKFAVTTKVKEQVSWVSPCWLPGDKILFALSASADSSAQPHWIDPKNSDPPTPIPCDVSNFWDPCWSPDMKQIAFRCDR